MRLRALWILLQLSPSAVAVESPSHDQRKRPLDETETAETTRPEESTITPYEPDVSCPVGYTHIRTTCAHRGHSAVYRLACRPPYVYDPKVLREFFASGATGERVLPVAGIHYVRGFCPDYHYCEPFEPSLPPGTAGPESEQGVKLPLTRPRGRPREPRLLYDHVRCVHDPSMRRRGPRVKRPRLEDEERDRDRDRDRDPDGSDAPGAPCEQSGSVGAAGPVDNGAGTAPPSSSLDDDDDRAFLEDIITYEHARLCGHDSRDPSTRHGRAQTQSAGATVGR